MKSKNGKRQVAGILLAASLLGTCTAPFATATAVLAAKEPAKGSAKDTSKDTVTKDPVAKAGKKRGCYYNATAKLYARHWQAPPARGRC